MKDILNKRIKPYAIYILPWFIVANAILVSYSFYKDARTQVSNADLLNAKPVTKQEIRSFLESINPEILKRIDEGQTEIHIAICSYKCKDLKDLSKRLDFDNYLRYKPTGDVCMGCDRLKDYILDLERCGQKDGHYFYPKDALRK
jgi:hypothetical protein